jgi:hypothetical protein
MGIRTDEESVGFQLLNAMAGNELENTRRYLGVEGDNLHALTTNLDEVYRVYKTVHDTSTQIPENAVVVGTTGSVEISVTEVEDLGSFLGSPPTRIETLGTRAVSGLSGNITGLSYMTNWHASGVWPMRDGDLHDVLIITQDTTPGDLAASSVLVYDYEDLSQPIYQYDWLRGSQNYVISGEDEVAQFEGGWYEVKNPQLIPNSLVAKDFSNLTGSGAPTEIDAAEIITSGNWVGMVGYDPDTNPIPAAWAGIVVLEYQYARGNQLGPLCASEGWSGLDYWNHKPFLTLMPASGVYGRSVPFQFSNTPVADEVRLVADPFEMRPGSTGHVEFFYDISVTGDWPDPSNAYVDFNLWPSSSFWSADPEWTYVLEPDDTLIDTDNYTVTGFNIKNSALRYTIASSGVVPQDSKIVALYRARDVYEVESTGSITSIDETGAWDWSLTEWGGSTYVAPKTLISVSTALNTALATAPKENFKLWHYPDYVGAAYNPYDNEVMVYDRNGATAEVYDAQWFTLKRRFPLTYTADPSSIVPSGGDGQEYPFLDLLAPTGTVLGALSIQNEYFINNDTINGTGYLSSIDTLGELPYDDLTYIDTFNYSGITDMTLSPSGTLLCAVGSDIQEYKLKWDYHIIDRGANIVYYRELYDYVEVSGVA